MDLASGWGIRGIWGRVYYVHFMGRWIDGITKVIQTVAVF